jgi:hypothetical protein
MPRAVAATACDIPKLDQLARNWKVVGTDCKDCKQGHLQVGDPLSFAKDVSGENNFSVAVTPGKTGRRASRTEGFALRADGVGNVRTHRFRAQRARRLTAAVALADRQGSQGRRQRPRPVQARRARGGLHGGTGAGRLQLQLAAA